MDREDIYPILVIEVSVLLLPHILEVVVALRFIIVVALLLVAVAEVLRWVFLAGVMEGEMRVQQRLSSSEKKVRELEKENGILRGIMGYEIIEDNTSRGRGELSRRGSYDIEAQRR